MHELETKFWKSKQSKVILYYTGCTRDVSHKEQLSFVLRIVSYEPFVSIAEHFLGFTDVEDTSGTSVLLDDLQKQSISDCHGWQTRIVCIVHSINLVVADAAKPSLLWCVEKTLQLIQLFCSTVASSKGTCKTAHLKTFVSNKMGGSD